jgi:leucyl/phenylalanyl-tRNA--protein transferase
MEPDGLLAIGGDLSPLRLLNAYRLGIFPWYDHEPILWWSPSPRAVIFLDSLHISNSLQKFLRQKHFTVRMDEQFVEVLQGCAGPRLREGKWESGTWLNPAMQAAYLTLHQQGYAHSIEVYEDNKLVGGLYGVALGKIFYGESMFSHKSNASKVAMAALVDQLQRWDFALMDCQVASPHLMRMGATTIPRQQFLDILQQNTKFDDKVSNWQLSTS